jgi:DNA polymerase-1
MINFGLLYGMEAYGLAQRLGISREEAQEHVDTYFAQFPHVRDFLKGLVEQARADGYTTTILGRRRYAPELSSANYRDRQAAERMALNAPIQGSAADVIKKAMIDLDPHLAPYASQMLLQIHDELVVEVPVEHVDAGRSFGRWRCSCSRRWSWVRRWCWRLMPKPNFMTPCSRPWSGRLPTR